MYVHISPSYILFYFTCIWDLGSSVLGLRHVLWLLCPVHALHIGLLLLRSSQPIHACPYALTQFTHVRKYAARTRVSLRALTQFEDNIFKEKRRIEDKIVKEKRRIENKWLRKSAE